MAIEEGLKIQIGADVTELINGFSKATKLLQSFAQTGEASAKDVEKAIRQLSKATKGLSGEELERVNTLIAKLRDTSAQLGKQATTGVQALGASLQDLSKDAATVTPQIEKLSSAITAIPEGAFSVSLDADVAAYLPKIEGASEALRQLGQTGIIAGDQAEAALIELGRAAENAGTADLLKLNAAIAAIGTASEKFRATGANAFDSFGNAVENAAKKVSIVGPAISNAVKEVEVVKAQGFTIKINAETKEAIAGLRFVSQATKELGATGEANITQVEKAIKDLNKALKNGGGGAAEVERLKVAISGLSQVAIQFGNAGKVGFDKFGQAIPGFIAAIESIPEEVKTTISVEGLDNAVQTINEKVASIDNAVNITPTVNESGAIADLGQISDKAIEAKDNVEQIGKVNPVLNVTTTGIDEAIIDTDSLGEKIDELKTKGDFEIELTVDAKNAISNLEHTDDALQRISKSGRASLRDVQQGMKFLTDAAKKPGAQLDKINAGMDRLTALSKQFKNIGKSGFDQFGVALDKTSKKLTQVRPASDQAGTALINLGRIAQDAPFGIIGIANNIDPLIQSLGSLTTAAKGPMGAIKALGGALAGGAGLALAVSVVTSTLTVAVQKYGSLGNAIEALFGRVNLLKKSQKDLMDAQEETNKSAGEEIARLQQLSNAAANTSKGYAERQTAVKLLKEEFPDYFKALSDEAILSGNVTQAVLATKAAIIQRAKASALLARSTDIESKSLTITQKREQAERDLAKAQAIVNDPKNTSVVLSQGEAVKQLSPAAQKAANDIKDLQSALKDLKKEENDLKADRTFIGGQLDTATVAPKNGESIDAAKEEIELLKKTIQTQEELNKTKAKTGGIDQALLANKVKLVELEGKYNKLSEDAINARTKALKVETNIEALNQSIAALERKKDLVGLNADQQERLNKLLIQQASIEGGAGAAQDLRLALDMTAIEEQIKTLERARETIGLVRSDARKLTDLKLQLFDLKNINTEFKPGEREKLIANLVNEINDAQPGNLAVRIKTEIIPVDTPEQIAKKITDLFPEGGFKIPINIAAAVNPLPKNINDPTADKTAEDEIDRKIEKTREYASIVSQELTPVFTSLFDTIGKGGQSAFQALGDAIKGILKKLAAAVIQAAIFAAIMAAIPGGGGFASAFGGQIGNLTGITGLFGSKPNQANLNRQQVRGNAANLGRETLVAQVSGNDLNFILRRNNTSNSRFA